LIIPEDETLASHQFYLLEIQQQILIAIFQINNWEDNDSSATLLDCKTVEEFVLLGDPSLQIGGYS